MSLDKKLVERVAHAIVEATLDTHFNCASTPEKDCKCYECRLAREAAIAAVTVLERKRS